MVREGMESPVDFSAAALFHAGPIVRENPPRYELVSIGPTTSSRMEEYAAAFIARSGLKMMIGKGGMGDKTAAACRGHGAVHCVYPGGCAVLGAGQVEKIENVFWRELGMSECLWVLRVREFGPLIVSIDTQGNNLFAESAARCASRREACTAPIIASL
jgi:L(+)-tartrate dehydratase beta subunit